jgi:hypothetical protein
MSISLWRKFLACLLAAAFVLFPIWSLTIKGVFSWHIRQPAAWQGGLELLVIMTGLIAAFVYLRSWKRWTLILALMWLYARHQGVDLAMAIDYLYVEGIFAFGWHLLPLLKYKKDRRPETFLLAGLLGVVSWSLCIWICSFAGFGSTATLQWLAIVVLGLSIVANKGARLAPMLVARIGGSTGSSAVFNALTITIMLALFAKSSVSTSYDSMWYGLNAGHVLVASGNIFSSEGLVAPVHYYPKLFEALQIPLSSFGSIPAIVGLSIFGWMLVLYTSSLILRDIGVGFRLRPAIVATIAALPALASISLTTKGDSFAAWLMSASLLGLIRFYSNRSAKWFWISACFAILSTQARLSNIPYSVFLLALLSFGIVVASRKYGVNELKRLLRSNSILIIIPVLVLTALITYRTMKLAGVPVIAPDFLVDIASRLGFSLRFPVGRLPSGAGVQHIPFTTTLSRYLFNPRKFTGIELAWTGNIWLYMPIFALLCGFHQWRKLNRVWIVLAIGLMFFPVLMQYSIKAGLDGNYFITPVLCMILFGAAMLHSVTVRSESTMRMAKFILFAFSISMAAIVFVTGSWGPGTRAFDTNLVRNPIDYPIRQKAELASSKLAGVASFFRGMPPRTRVVGDVNSEGWWLPIRYEPMAVMAWGLRTQLNTAADISDFLTMDSIEYVLISEPHSPYPLKVSYSDALSKTMINLEEATRAKKVYSDSYFQIWKLNESLRQESL